MTSDHHNAVGLLLALAACTSTPTGQGRSAGSPEVRVSGQDGSTTGSDGATATSHFCDSHCGQQAKSGCYCDAPCSQHGDCCNAAGSSPSKDMPGTSCGGSTCGDCNGSMPKSQCGNGACEAGESIASCPKDCPPSGSSGGHWCDRHCTNDKQPSGCYCDGQCNQFGDCCNADGSAPTKANPNKSCTGSVCKACGGAGGGAVCGNGLCEAGEDTANCAKDCPSGGGGGATCTTYADVQPIFQTKCAGCHNFGGECSMASKYTKIKFEVQSGAMPPNGGLSPEDKAKIAAWAAGKNACTAAQCP
jgi:hypothetical protein